MEADSLHELERHTDSTWASIFGIDFVEHLSKDALIHFLSLAQRKLKPGGNLILRMPNGDSPLLGRNLYNDITHIWAYTTVAMTSLAHMAGFERVEYADEAMASLERQRWLKVPLMRVSQALLHGLIMAATRERVQWLSPSLFVCAWKRSKNQ